MLIYGINPVLEALKAKRATLIRVSPRAEDDEMEAARFAVERGLDEVHRQGYAMVGASDPGADLRSR